MLRNRIIFTMGNNGCKHDICLDIDISNTTSFENLFNNVIGKMLFSIDAKMLNTSNITDMGTMFSYCGKLTNVNLSGWDTSNVTNMESMFYDCSGLTSLDLSTWDTSKVTNIYQMFFNCSRLTSLDLSNWDLSSISSSANTRNIFSCRNLSELKLNNWKLPSWGFRFSYTSLETTQVTSLDLSTWDTSNVTNMRYMFSDCTSLSEIKMGGDVSKVTQVLFMFDNITTTGTFYYNSAYNYSKILAELPSTWTAVPCTMVDGVLVPNE